MIRKIINVDNYWKVIVYYNIDYNFFSIISRDLKRLDCNSTQIKEVFNNMSNRIAKAVTISSIYYKTSIVLFNTHNSVEDYINSIVHEAEHIKQSMLSAYNVKDEGEEPAYTVGYLASKILSNIIV